MLLSAGTTPLSFIQPRPQKCHITAQPADTARCPLLPLIRLVSTRVSASWRLSVWRCRTMWTVGYTKQWYTIRTNKPPCEVPVTHVLQPVCQDFGLNFSQTRDLKLFFFIFHHVTSAENFLRVMTMFYGELLSPRGCLWQMHSKNVHSQRHRAGFL